MHHDPPFGEPILIPG